MLSLDRQVGRHHDLWPAPLSGCGYVNPAGSDPLGSTAAAASAALSGVLQQALGHGQPPQQADLNGVQDAPLGGIGGGGADQAATTRAAAGQPPWQQPWPPDVVCPRRAAGPPLDGLACSPIAPVMAVGASVDGHAGLSPFSPDRFRNPLRLASQDQVPINAMHVDYAGAALPTVGWAMRNLSPRRALGSTPRVEAPPSRAATPPGLPAARFALDARVPTCSPEAAPGLGGAPPQWAFGAGAAAVAGVASTQPWRAAEGTAAGHAAVLLASESHQSA
ncbi:unnamed protein product [Prorocentrum cordatum]|uniref:Subtilisin n=1 Tax=Prorocentrum cordatum TaxID=2364126 RepID=A0ABN9SNU0_9DINO|nr:unnamed protein product [Polarella glacialis]